MEDCLLYPTNTNTNANTNTQIQIRKYKHTNTNTNTQIDHLMIWHPTPGWLRQVFPFVRYVVDLEENILKIGIVFQFLSFYLFKLNFRYFRQKLQFSSDFITHLMDDDLTFVKIAQGREEIKLIAHTITTILAGTGSHWKPFSLNLFDLPTPVLELRLSGWHIAWYLESHCANTNTQYINTQIQMHKYKYTSGGTSIIRVASVRSDESIFTHWPTPLQVLWPNHFMLTK